MELMDFSLKAGLALLGGFGIGIEREIRHKSAGLKTNSLVSLGACIFVLLSLEFRGEAYVDTSRVIGQIVTGIGFIGAGTILQRGSKVAGLTTAATIWCSAGVGCLAALGMFKELLVVCFMVVLVNLIFSFAERKIFHKEPED
ncbi:MgtC/SapB family protein [Antarcticibacterium arcticum]|uniref:MgtC/SapB family protein n=1 Tax=Antarcticibacterium arcticum TaxID=2585771 RepID=A0A5B8YKA4_9FLAO|nr:MgtC/SapB family protein [Antarcticibacterium arcticum]QED38292.1 MgtC/SapB family protein [Antarcticibacterium arcticum]